LGRGRSGIGDPALRVLEEHCCCRPGCPFFLPAGAKHGTAYRLLRYSQLVGHLLLAAVLAVARLQGAEAVHYPPLGLRPLLDKTSNQPKHSLGVCTGHGTFLVLGRDFPATAHSARHHRQWHLARGTLRQFHGFARGDESASRPFAGAASRSQLHHTDTDPDVPVPAAEGMQGDIHHFVGLLHHALELVTYRTFKARGREALQCGNQLRHAIDVGGAAPLVNGQNVHVLTVCS
jgi:hypothetical protein